MHARMMLRGSASSTRVAARPLRVLAAWLLMSCGAPPRAPESAVIASGTDLESGNPAVTIHTLSRQLQRHALFVTLVRLDSALQAVPYYARSWTWSADHRQVEFVLDSSLTWHDGVRTTSSDVQFTIEAVQDRELGSPRAGDLAAVDSVRTRGDDSVRLYFRQPLAVLPVVLAELPLVPRHILDTVPLRRWRSHAFSTAPVGNGPFRFADRIAGRRWRFVRNERFPRSMGGPPALRQLVVAVVDEAATKYAGLVSGELDLAGVSPTMAHLVARDPTLALLTPPALFSTILAFNTTKPPFDDARVRRAFALALDRARIVKAAVAGYATPASGAVPPGLPFYAAGNALPDTKEADRLLDEAGWKRAGNGLRTRAGTGLIVELLTVGSGDLAVEQLVQADLAARGIDVKVRVAEMASFLTTVRAPDKRYDFALTGIPGDLALGHLSALFASSQKGGALDYTAFHSPLLDSALARARSAPASEAASAWSAVDRVLADSAPVAWIYHARGVQGRSRRLEGVVMDLRGELVSVTRWTREDGK